MKYTGILNHLAAAAIITILVAFVYAAVQQAHRAAANDPQLQIARDIANDVSDQNAINKWFMGDKMEISESLGVFNVLYNNKGEPILSTGLLSGHLPVLPVGVFDFAKQKGENVFTWQPLRGTRIAMVLKVLRSSPYSFVAVGRSLLEVEKREKDLRWMTFISWLLCIAVIMTHWIIAFFNNGKFEN